MARALVGALVVLIVLGALALVAHSICNKQAPPLISGRESVVPSAVGSSSLSAQWKIYRNERLGIELKYPNRLSAVSEAADRVWFRASDGAADGIEVTTNPTAITDYQNYPPCPAGYPASTPLTTGIGSCIVIGDYRGSADTASRTIDGMKAHDFYVLSSDAQTVPAEAETLTHVIQTVDQPRFEASASRHAQGLGDLDDLFDRMMASIRFVRPTPTAH
jgi:hypothetical protein